MATLAAYDPGHGIHPRSWMKTSLSDHSYRGLAVTHQELGARLSSSPEWARSHSRPNTMSRVSFGCKNFGSKVPEQVPNKGSRRKKPSSSVPLCRRFPLLLYMAPCAFAGGTHFRAIYKQSKTWRRTYALDKCGQLDESRQHRVLPADSEPTGMRVLAPRSQQAGGREWQWRMPRGNLSSFC